jgi:hypothetical protein
MWRMYENDLFSIISTDDDDDDDFKIDIWTVDQIPP